MHKLVLAGLSATVRAEISRLCRLHSEHLSASRLGHRTWEENKCFFFEKVA